MAFEEAQARVAELTAGRILVGHSIKNDLTALLLSHPRGLVRDTARCVRLLCVCVCGGACWGRVNGGERVWGGSTVAAAPSLRSPAATPPAPHAATGR